MMRPNWFDSAFEDVVAEGDEKSIAEAVLNSPKVLEAIKGALVNPGDRVIGPTAPQRVRQAIADVLNAS